MTFDLEVSLRYIESIRGLTPEERERVGIAEYYQPQAQRFIESILRLSSGNLPVEPSIAAYAISIAISEFATGKKTVPQRLTSIDENMVHGTACKILESAFYDCLNENCRVIPTRISTSLMSFLGRRANFFSWYNNSIQTRFSWYDAELRPQNELDELCDHCLKDGYSGFTLLAEEESVIDEIAALFKNYITLF